jgi:hypothetical protein
MTSASNIGRSPFAALLLAGTLGVLGGCTAEPEQVAVEGSSKAAKLTQCVEPTDFMRRNHMELIKHQRHETVHEGVRATNHGLAGCIDCHVQYDAGGQPIPVNASGQFCDSCHQYAAVQLDCFQCHATIPTEGDAPAVASVAAAGLGAAMAQVGVEQHDTLPRLEQEKGN